MSMPMTDRGYSTRPMQFGSADSPPQAKMRLAEVSVCYGSVQAVGNVSMQIPNRKITALIGPSGCGKTTILRALNRMNELEDNVRTSGSVFLEDENIYAENVDVNLLRKRVGMVFQKPNPFPASIFDNIAYGPRIHGEKDKRKLSELVETSLKRVGLFDEVKDALHRSAYALSGGQMQRLCIARAVSVDPEVLLMDEPTSALDPGSSMIVEELIKQLSEQLAIVIVTHNMQQARRLSHQTAFMYKGALIEVGATEDMFRQAREQRTRDYLSGVFG